MLSVLYLILNINKMENKCSISVNAIKANRTCKSPSNIDTNTNRVDCCNNQNDIANINKYTSASTINENSENEIAMSYGISKNMHKVYNSYDEVNTNTNPNSRATILEIKL